MVKVESREPSEAELSALMFEPEEDQGSSSVAVEMLTTPLKVAPPPKKQKSFMDRAANFLSRKPSPEAVAKAKPKNDGRSQ